MDYKYLQNANVDISLVGIGTWAMGGQRFGDVTREESIQVNSYNDRSRCEYY